MKYDFFGIRWASAQNMWFFLLLIPIFICLIIRYKKQLKTVSYLVAFRWRSLLLKGFSLKKSILKVILFLIGSVFLFIGLLQPQWGHKEEIVKQQGRDLFIALDVSRSMLARDVKPDRLSLAKQKIKKLLYSLSSERVGLILFSGDAFIQCPLTTDTSAFNLFLDQINAETISSGTTALDQAIKKTLKAFSSIPGRKNKLLFIFTDGEDYSSNLAGLQNEARKAGLRIYTIGMATQKGAPIPIFDKEGTMLGHQKDENGAIVISKLNEGILRNLSQATDGKYIRVTQDDRDIFSVQNEIEQFEKEEIEDKKIVDLKERYYYFIAISLLAFIFEWLL